MCPRQGFPEITDESDDYMKVVNSEGIELLRKASYNLTDFMENPPLPGEVADADGYVVISVKSSNKSENAK